MLTLVTGATGEVGRRFVPRLLARTAPGDAVRVLVRDEERGAPAATLGAQVTVGELRDPEAVRKALAGVDTVLNIAAAFRGVPDEEAWAVNRDAALELGRGAVEAGAGRFVQVSTNLVYGAGRGRPAVEDDEPLPGSPMWGAYPASKSAAEQGLLALHREHGLDVRIGRLAFVYGEGDPHLAQSLRWAGGWAGHQRLTMVHHADVAQGLLRLLRAPGAAGRVYNIADDAPVSAVELHQLNGVELPAGMAGRPLDDPWEGVVSTARIRDELGFSPRYPSVWTAWDAGAL
ncbi:NAD(P)-dependent oxidoreductase [Streptomyces sp. So13.3]|uniref:NAD-dependent epimerase/dehydratase family protein n=1 Tax=Streptomyces TaxID=1883 RepID=UPI001107091D|nr:MULTISPECIES: NAD(P)-dependent oxidoreductase [Streptomyces]MCZ4100563.1 NAD(P)-dependent oxidoreductase [Streptomyces sp. H39-C1]QNA72352.1 NAD(P)-dependent oxidoreductase [Streptomyces sp. So13.3]